MMKLEPAALDTKISFFAFVEAVSSQAPAEMDRHWRVQRIQCFFDHIDFSFVGHFEYFERDLKYVLETIFPNHEPVLKEHRQHATRANETAREFYGARIQETVYRLYQTDFETFGYCRALVAEPIAGSTAS